jgi:hypothetical protein
MGFQFKLQLELELARPKELLLIVPQIAQVSFKE